ncbi:hypothetical protein XH92_33345 [Bradyrhizobium sp. CCBAU 53421]|nr:hypothetical protein XH92_33345 [Bradyrhizobium sp. CCBAU 53421]
MQLGRLSSEIGAMRQFKAKELRQSWKQRPRAQVEMHLPFNTTIQGVVTRKWHRARATLHKAISICQRCDNAKMIDLT